MRCFKAPVGMSNVKPVMKPRSSIAQIKLPYRSKNSSFRAATPEPFWLVGMTGQVVVFCWIRDVPDQNVYE